MEKNDKQIIRKCSWKFKCKKNVYIWVNTKKNLLYSPLCKWHYVIACIKVFFRRDKIYKRIKEEDKDEYFKKEDERERKCK